MALNTDGDDSASARLIVDFPAPSGPMSATENMREFIARLRLLGCGGLCIEILPPHLSRDNSVSLRTAKSGHDCLIELALVLGCPRFAQEAEVAKANVPVIADLV